MVIFSHITALHYWRHAAHAGSFDRGGRPTSLATARADLGADEARTLAEQWRLPLPLHVLVSPCARRRRAGTVESHRRAGHVTPAMLVQLGRGVYVCAPELTFLQVAGLLTFPNLVRFGYELCGAYAFDNGAPGGIARRAPLAKVRSLQSFLAASSGAHHVKTARRTTRYVADNAYSPLESTVAELLSLPCPLGGYGFSLPHLNRSVSLAGPDAAVENIDALRPDLYWPKGPVALECDSDAFHPDNPSRQTQDAQRRALLQNRGITVLTVKTAQINSLTKFDEVARAVGRCLGVRPFKRSYDILSRRIDLRSELLGTAPSAGDQF